MPVNVSNPEDLRGATVTTTGGDKLGKVDEVYLDNDTGKPEWAAVKTGLFGSNISLVPLAAADWAGGSLSVPFDKDRVKNAPNHDSGAELSVEDERELFTYYGVPYGGETVTATGAPDTTTGIAGRSGGLTDITTTSRTASTGTASTGTASTGTAGTIDTASGHDTSGPSTDDAMTRSEERVRVGVERREAGRARLRKYITSETVTQAVPVRHEEVTLQREAITEANVGSALSGGDLTEEVHEVTLHEERPVVDKETVPVERVRLGTQEVTSQETVSADVRKENVEIENDARTTTEH